MPFNKKDAAQKANFVKFAYNMFQPGVLNPPVDPGIANSGYQFLYYLNATDFQAREFYGYIAGSVATPGQYVLAIRGTETLAEWLLDFSAIPVVFEAAPDAGLVALGFQSIYQSFEFVDADGVTQTLQQVVGELAAKSPGITEFIVVGHSLGGALGTLTAAELGIVNPANVRDKVVSYTFASPRVGLLDFASSFNDAVPVSYRIWNTLDIVSQTPTFPYIHVSGLGDAVVQTESQLETLVVTPACEHDLTSYQWLLDPDNFHLEMQCSDVATNLKVAAMALAVGHTAANHRASARALRKAMTGHA
jgi:Lipase (class 3)